MIILEVQSIYLQNSVKAPPFMVQKHILPYLGKYTSKFLAIPNILFKTVYI